MSSEWQMAFPVTEEGREITNVTLITDGVRILYFPSQTFANELNDYLSEQAKLWLSSKDIVTPEELAEFGIKLRLNNQTLQVEMKLTSEASALRTIALDNVDSSQDLYSAAANWSWQNNFNLSYQYYDWSDRYSTRVDWLGAANVGGVDGLNATYRFYFNQSDRDTDFYRGNSQLYYDNVDAPWRLAVGDVESTSVGHLPGISLGGVSWERNYASLQPYRQLKNSGTQSLDLTESAEVTIYINEIRVSRLRLTPGRYELDDLPLTNGTNEIRLEVLYVSGGTKTIIYTQFYNGQLLREGLSDFSLAVGAQSQQIESGLEYEDQAIISGFYEYGVNDKLTLAANGLAHERGQLFGFSVVNGSFFGNISLRATASQSSESKRAIGNIVSVDYSQQIFGSSPYGSPNLRLGIDWQDSFSPQPWLADEGFTYTLIRSDYQWYISDHLDASLYASYRDEPNGNVQYDMTTKLNWRNPYWRVSLVGEYIASSDEVNEYKGYFNVEFYYDLFSNKHRFNTSYNSDLKRARVELQKAINSYVGDYGYKLSAENTDGDQSYLGRTEFNANRWRGQFELESQTNVGKESKTSAFGNLSSSVILADGHLAWGRAGIGSNTLINVHKTLSNSHVHINPNSTLEPESIATSAVGNFVSLSRTHEPNTVKYSVPDAPVGYSLGAGINSYKPGSLTTHILTVGSNATKTFISTALEPSGNPISLFSGIATHRVSKKAIPVFTNSSGRFVIDGAEDGDYKIELGSWVGAVTIKENSPTLIYADNLIMQRKENEND
ncbi:fimbria/pilus outer membrane usher protein [Vibrio alginolyticus]|nr:fimbria/pilus outer membrane usher protein [Vibrio alginolyticus]